HPASPPQTAVLSSNGRSGPLGARFPREGEPKSPARRQRLNDRRSDVVRTVAMVTAPQARRTGAGAGQRPARSSLSMGLDSSSMLTSLNVWTRTLETNRAGL